MDRREFAKNTLLAIASGVLGVSCAVPVPQKNNYKSSSRGFVYLCFASGNKSLLRELNLDTYEYKETELPISTPHAVTRVGDDIYAFGLFGSAAKVTGTGKVILADHTKGEGYFLGHGLISHDNEMVWTTEMKTFGHAVVRARSLNDLKIVNGHGYEFIGGHHLVRLPGTDLIATCGAEGERYYVYFYNLKRFRMENKVPCNYPGLHLLPISDSEVVITTTEFRMFKERLINFERMGNPKTRATMTEKEKQFAGFSPVIYANVNGEVKELWNPKDKEIFQHGLGLDSAGSERFISSHYSSDSVILWKGQEIEKVFKVPSPLIVVVTEDAKSFLVQSEGNLVIYSLETGLVEKVMKFEYPLLSLSRY